MCEPVTAGLMIGGGLLNAYSIYKQGQGAADQAQQNATLAGTQAADALQRGAVDVGHIRTAGTQAIANEKVAYANSGVDVQSGTPASTMADTRALSELDAATERNNAARQAWGFKVEQSNYSNQASADRQQAVLGAAGSLLGTAGQAGSILGHWMANRVGPTSANVDPSLYAQGGKRFASALSGYVRPSLGLGAGDLGGLGPTRYA